MKTASLKSFLKRIIRRVAGGSLFAEIRAEGSSAQEVQIGLLAQYIAMRSWPRERLPKFSDIGFQKYSQFEEDGLLLFIFGLIGTTNKRVVEVCAGSGSECMAANLIINHGWKGYLFDGDESDVLLGREFYARRKTLLFSQPEYRQAWITAETVNETLREAGAAGPIDLLSLDIDGMDYWVWKEIDAIQPRVCIFETVNYIPSNMALTARYKPDFSMARTDPASYYRGASTLAFAKLSREKGYRLIGSHRYGFNCIFMKDGVGEDYFPEVTVEHCHDIQRVRDNIARLWPQIKSYDWQEV